jgi:hypothetical protein
VTDEATSPAQPTQPSGPVRRATSSRQRYATHVDVDVQDSVRATVAALQRLVGPHVTLGSFTTEALAEHVRRAEREHNDGNAFEAGTGVQLRPGARIKGPSTRNGGPDADDERRSS